MRWLRSDTLVAALAVTSTVALAAQVPYCSANVTANADGKDASACADTLSIDSMWNLTDVTTVRGTFCASKACQDYYVALAGSGEPNCLYHAKGGTVTVKDFTDEFVDICRSLSRPLPTVNRTASPSTTAPGASAATTTPVTTTTTPTAASSDTSSSSSTTLAVVVIVACVVVVGLVVAVVMRRRRTSAKSQAPDATANATDTYEALADREATPETGFPESDTLLPFRIPFHKLHLGKVISQGGFGEVLRASYNADAVVVKRLLASRRGDAKNIRSFVQEIRLTASLEHECIVRFIGAAWEKDGSTLCMVSEFMHGGDLRSLLAAYATNGHAHGHDDTKLRMAIHVAHAMTFLHTLAPPVVHRDLKSRNILLTPALDAKLIDFGVSCEFRDVTLTKGVGTSLWMAPEVMLGQRYDGKADVFSFGVLLSELDTHQLPYDHVRDTTSGQPLTDFVLLQLISQGRLKPRFTDAAHPQIVDLARDCLHRNPTERPTAAEVVARIDDCLQHDRTLTDRTRTAIDRALVTVETTRAVYTRRSDSFEMSMDTRETTRAPSP